MLTPPGTGAGSRHGEVATPARMAPVSPAVLCAGRKRARSTGAADGGGCGGRMPAAEETTCPCLGVCVGGTRERRCFRRLSPTRWRTAALPGPPGGRRATPADPCVPWVKMTAARQAALHRLFPHLRRAVLARPAAHGSGGDLDGRTPRPLRGGGSGAERPTARRRPRPSTPTCRSSFLELAGDRPAPGSCGAFWSRCDKSAPQLAAARARMGV